MTCQRIHLTDRGELVSDTLAAILALIIIPVTGFSIIWIMLP